MFDLGPSRARGRTRRDVAPTSRHPSHRHRAQARRPGRRGEAVPWRRRARWQEDRVRERRPEGEDAPLGLAKRRGFVRQHKRPAATGGDA